ncbi:hypothetical protein COB64_03105 [Candidatus Wolfebacteria bacterium]|nr:MAG: hypothetical protein COB64_03105 [Candidatus Wolfebacteria bacterium]
MENKEWWKSSVSKEEKNKYKELLESSPLSYDVIEDNIEVLKKKLKDLEGDDSLLNDEAQEMVASIDNLEMEIDDLEAGHDDITEGQDEKAKQAVLADMKKDLENINAKRKEFEPGILDLEAKIIYLEKGLEENTKTSDN